MVSLPKVGQGTAFDLYKNKISKKEISNILSEGILNGLNFIDTAESYGNGEIEKTVGSVVGNNRERIILATKFSPQNSEYKKVIKSCEGSLRRLKTDYIDVFQIHWPNPRVPIEETIDALVYLKRSGKIREFGAGNFSLKLLMQTKKILGNEKLFSLQTEYNPLERSIEQNGVYDFCTRNKINVIAFSPLDQGRLSFMGEKQRTTVANIAKSYNKTVAQIILAWIISAKIVPIPMTLKIKHLIENLEAGEIQLSKKHLKQLDKIFHSTLKYILPKDINVLRVGERNSKAYRTLTEAKRNKFGFVPSPSELAEEFKIYGFLKPVRLIKNSSSVFKYNLISGRVRFWGWVIAYGKNKPIPAYIRENLKMN